MDTDSTVSGTTRSRLLMVAALAVLLIVGATWLLSDSPNNPDKPSPASERTETPKATPGPIEDKPRIANRDSSSPKTPSGSEAPQVKPAPLTAEEKETIAKVISELRSQLEEIEIKNTSTVQRVKRESSEVIHLRVLPPSRKEIDSVYKSLSLQLGDSGTATPFGRRLWKSASEVIDEYVQFRRPHKFLQIVIVTKPDPLTRVTELYVDNEASVRPNENGILKISLDGTVDVRDDSDYITKRYGRLIEGVIGN